MPVTYRFDRDVLHLDFDGDYELSEITRTFQAAMEDPACPPRVPLLVDVRRSTSLESRSSDQVRAIAEWLGPYAARIGGRCAIVAESAIHYGLSRMGSAYSEGVGVQTAVFREPEAALEWLGVKVGS